jgi:hypothetical protein
MNTTRIVTAMPSARVTNAEFTSSTGTPLTTYSPNTKHTAEGIHLINSTQKSSSSTSHKNVIHSSSFSVGETPLNIVSHITKSKKETTTATTKREETFSTLQSTVKARASSSSSSPLPSTLKDSLKHLEAGRDGLRSTKQEEKSTTKSTITTVKVVSQTSDSEEKAKGSGFQKESKGLLKPHKNDESIKEISTSQSPHVKSATIQSKVPKTSDMKDKTSVTPTPRATPKKRRQSSTFRNLTSKQGNDTKDEHLHDKNMIKTGDKKSMDFSYGQPHQKEKTSSMTTKMKKLEAQTKSRTLSSSHESGDEKKTTVEMKKTTSSKLTSERKSSGHLLSQTTANDRKMKLQKEVKKAQNDEENKTASSSIKSLAISASSSWTVSSGIDAKNSLNQMTNNSTLISSSNESRNATSMISTTKTKKTASEVNTSLRKSQISSTSISKTVINQATHHISSHDVHHTSEISKSFNAIEVDPSRRAMFPGSQTTTTRNEVRRITPYNGITKKIMNIPFGNTSTRASGLPSSRSSVKIRDPTTRNFFLLFASTKDSKQTSPVNVKTKSTSSTTATTKIVSTIHTSSLSKSMSETKNALDVSKTGRMSNHAAISTTKSSSLFLRSRPQNYAVSTQVTVAEESRIQARSSIKSSTTINKQFSMKSSNVSYLPSTIKKPHRSFPETTQSKPTRASGSSRKEKTSTALTSSGFASKLTTTIGIKEEKATRASSHYTTPMQDSLKTSVIRDVNPKVDNSVLRNLLTMTFGDLVAALSKLNSKKQDAPEGSITKDSKITAKPSTTSFTNDHSTAKIVLNKFAFSNRDVQVDLTISKPGDLFEWRYSKNRTESIPEQFRQMLRDAGQETTTPKVVTTPPPSLWSVWFAWSSYGTAKRNYLDWLKSLDYSLHRELSHFVTSVAHDDVTMTTTPTPMRGTSPVGSRLTTASHHRNSATSKVMGITTTEKVNEPQYLTRLITRKVEVGVKKETSEENQKILVNEKLTREKIEKHETKQTTKICYECSVTTSPSNVRLKTQRRLRKKEEIGKTTPQHRDDDKIMLEKRSNLNPRTSLHQTSSYSRYTSRAHKFEETRSSTKKLTSSIAIKSKSTNKVHFEAESNTTFKETIAQPLHWTGKTSLTMSPQTPVPTTKSLHDDSDDGGIKTRLPGNPVSRKSVLVINKDLVRSTSDKDSATNISARIKVTETSRIITWRKSTTVPSDKTKTLTTSKSQLTVVSTTTTSTPYMKATNWDIVTQAPSTEFSFTDEPTTTKKRKIPKWKRILKENRKKKRRRIKKHQRKQLSPHPRTTTRTVVTENETDSPFNEHSMRRRKRDIEFEGDHNSVTETSSPNHDPDLDPYSYCNVSAIESRYDAAKCQKACYMKCSVEDTLTAQCEDACFLLRCYKSGGHEKEISERRHNKDDCETSCSDACKGEKHLKQHEEGIRRMDKKECFERLNKYLFLWDQEHHSQVLQEVKCNDINDKDSR